MEWHIITAAIVTGTSLHSVMEPANVNTKLTRLKKAIKTGKISELKMQGIDTRPKAYGLGLLAIAVPSAIAYLIIQAINPSVEAAIQYTAAVALFGEALLIVGLDKYHVAIEKLTQAQKRSK